jgi:Ca-activated chloride channel family protein
LSAFNFETCMRRLIITLIGAILCFLILPYTAIAADKAAMNLDAVLVVDVSNSMNQSDADKVSYEAMKMFVDMLSLTGDNVGVIAYTDEVLSSKPMIKIESQQDKEEIKQFIDNLQRGPFTDNAVGVTEAVKMLEGVISQDREPLIIMLADGNNYLNKSTGRTQGQSDEEMETAIKLAEDKGIKIYTIGLNADGKLNKDELTRISERTGGIFFETSEAERLPNIFNQIFANHLRLKLIPISNIQMTGDFQEIELNIPNDSVLEANISVMSSSPVELRLIDQTGAEVPVPGPNAILSQSNVYSVLKVIKPTMGNWKLLVKGVKEDDVTINLVYLYDLELAMDALKESYVIGEDLNARVYLTSNGAPLQSPETYKGVTATLNVKDMATGISVSIPMVNEGDAFTSTYKIEAENEYEIRVTAEGDGFTLELDPVITKGVTQPIAQSISDASGNSSTWLILLLVILLILLAIILTYIIRAYLKKKNRGFPGQMIIEIRDRNTGESSPPQYKKLKGYKGRFNLHQLLQLAPELKETEKILFTHGKNDELILRNTSASELEKSGRAIDASKGMEFKNSDRLTLVLHHLNKEINIEYMR